MRNWGIVTAVIGICALACSASTKSEERGGTLSVALTGTDTRGEQYRLRGATFYVQGYPDYFQYEEGGAGGASASYFFQQISTETEPDGPTISRRVLPGSYYVTLQNGGWYIEHVTAAGSERVQDSVLLSNAQTWTRVYDGSQSNVYYSFGVDGKLIDFRNGDLNIRIQIEHPNDNNVGGAGAGGALD
jgi:hypothetical protein